jgi:site-specific DNA-methyltransferase (adenine-specific)
VAVTTPARPPGATAAATSPDAAWTVLRADSLEALAELPSESVDAVVCDPPYGINFNGHNWDGAAIRNAASATTARQLSGGEAFQCWTQTWAAECLRLLRPGGHLAAFGAPRTFHRLACGVEDARLELRDVLLWLYGTGMPKSRRLAGGRGTALKPAYEPILLARKPPAAPTERNIALYGTGALNIETCRLGARWPANLLLSHHPACHRARCHRDCPTRIVDAAATAAASPPRGATVERASRLFYCPKASRRERDAGCERLPRQALDLFPNAHRNGKPPAAAANAHPTVKPLAVMRWLLRLVTPTGGLVLDPFCGSGSTGCAAALEQRRFLGIEREVDYVAVARARIAHWSAEAQQAKT